MSIGGVFDNNGTQYIKDFYSAPFFLHNFIQRPNFWQSKMEENELLTLGWHVLY
jgi:hypothetical protein